MIDIPQELLLSLLLRSLAGGAILGIFYDVIRAIKMLCGVRYGKNAGAPLSRGGKIAAYTVTFVTDVLFWICVGLISIALIYSVGGGRFRGMTYLALAAGFLVYYLTLGRLVLKISAMAVKILKKVLKRTLSILSLPIRWLLRGIISLYHLTIGKIIGKIKIAMAASREKKREAASVSIAEPAGECGGKEDFVYADEKYRYRKEGRISFGRRPDR